MRPSLVLCVASLAACGSESSKPSLSNTGSGGGSATGAGGVAGSGVTGTSAGTAGESGGGGEGGLAGAGGAPGGDRPPSLLLLSGSATLEVDDPDAGLGGAAGASGLPPIDRVECSFYAEVLDLVAHDDSGWSGIAVGEVFRNRVRRLVDLRVVGAQRAWVPRHGSRCRRQLEARSRAPVSKSSPFGQLDEFCTLAGCFEPDLG